MPPSLSTVRRAGKNRKSSWARRPAALAERVEQAQALDPVVRRLSDGVVRARMASTAARAFFTAGRSSIPWTHRATFGNFAIASAPKNIGIPRIQGKVATSATEYSEPAR